MLASKEQPQTFRFSEQNIFGKDRVFAFHEKSTRRHTNTSIFTGIDACIQIVKHN